jgi:hypothetical protein
MNEVTIIDFHAKLIIIRGDLYILDSNLVDSMVVCIKDIKAKFELIYKDITNKIYDHNV